ncbi:YkgJ family cysteine cluster protein [Maridesulfovibrio sp. FT414]|uniref:YkgJ family cysteine cluster protein n=1 Tax=Maridesulfovibrio sp. FT414 TaxID=2979469 RepID=UPI003D806420
MTSRHRLRGSGARKKVTGLSTKAEKGIQAQAVQAVQNSTEIMAARIAEERHAVFKKNLGRVKKGQSAKVLIDLVSESYEIFDRMLGDLVLDPPLACKRGCIYCCINQVSLTEPEALFIGFHLLETRTSEQRVVLQQMARTLLENLQGKSRQEIGMNRHMYPCLFMEDGTCSIYAARPLSCRGWNSVDADMCRHSNQSGDALAPIENHPLPRVMAESIQLGLLNGSSEMQLETGYLLLPRAAYLLLQEKDEKGMIELADNWLNGQPFFAKKIDL